MTFFFWFLKEIGTYSFKKKIVFFLKLGIIMCSFKFDWISLDPDTHWAKYWIRIQIQCI